MSGKMKKCIPVLIDLIYNALFAVFEGIILSFEASQSVPVPRAAEFKMATGCKFLSLTDSASQGEIRKLRKKLRQIEHLERLERDLTQEEREKVKQRSNTSLTTLLY